MKRTTARTGRRRAGDEGDTALDALRHSSAASLPRSGERLLPWLGVASVVGIAGVGLTHSEPTSAQGGALLITLFATVVVGGLVAVQSRAAAEEAQREERARPAREQLVDLDAAAAERPVTRSYLDGVERWTIALSELFAHAIDVATDDEVRAELINGREDADALHDLLAATTGRDLSLNEAATLHSICTLWETDQDRLEQLAAEIDPPWHRRWRGRSVVERLLRHGPPQRAQLALPYRR